MKQKTIFIGITILLVLIFTNCSKKSDSSALKGLYLGQTGFGARIHRGLDIA